MPTRKKTPPRRKPSPSPVVAALLASPGRCTLPAKALADVAEVVAINAAGERHITAHAVAVGLRRAYGLPHSICTIRRRVIEAAGGAW